jgi:STE24 endopeptidase
MSTLVFFLYLLEVLAWAGLLALDLRHGRRHGTEVPRGFEGQLDLETLRRISAYTRESTAFSLLALAAWNACLLGFLFGGGIEAYDRWIDSLGLDAAQGRFLFFFVLLAGLHTFGVVAGLIETFRIEAKYGFARSGIGAWLRDQAVRRIRSAILWALCGTATAAFLDNLPPQPWIWALALPLPSYLAWAFLLPLWLHWTERGFQRLANPELEAPVRALVEKAGFRVSGVYTWKASRWTGHTNAWFAGIGRTRRVVLFDTLIASMGIAEILAVTAHELGHWPRLFSSPWACCWPSRCSMRGGCPP